MAPADIRIGAVTFKARRWLGGIHWRRSLSETCAWLGSTTADIQGRRRNEPLPSLIDLIDADSGLACAPRATVGRNRG